MATVLSVADELHHRLQQAIAAALPEAGDIDPQLRRSDRADFQANGLLGLAKKLGHNPRALAEQVLTRLDYGPTIAAAEVSGPGFINITLSDAAIGQRTTERAHDPQLGVAPLEDAGTTVIDYSQPNIAKEMHVGHLRSTIIGDAVVRILQAGGETVVRHNHIGDWGTQFGMLIQDLRERPEQLDAATDDADAATDDADAANASMSRLNRLYRDARARFDTDPDFADRARHRVVELQAGDAETVEAWHRIVAESKVYFEAVYERLDVLLTDEDTVGESFYNPYLAEVSEELERTGVAVRSDGALCVFFDDITGPDGQLTPLIVQKKDGGYGYAATDLAAIRYRTKDLGAHQLLYVVDARQALHFQMVFETARRAGWLAEPVSARHLAFGTVLGPDGRPFKTRSGETVRLMELLQEAVDRARTVVTEKNPHMPQDELEERARQVGIGAVKYADLSTSRTRDYIFDVDRMVSLNGNTGVYLQYAYARIRSILRKADQSPQAGPDLPLEAAERDLGLLLDEFGAALRDVVATYEPHRLCSYLFALASAFTTFYEQCPVLKAPSAEIIGNRLMLCELTGQTLRTGMNLLGIATPERL
ncbi:arginine--tRNA ligase [Streptomonospora litoralis]|uniref:Arginine--tRNA ligase n=1 Tax=Streptomonospora litoralis TaxID=2498135 RepID=A0A4P6Q976_9ACTN|nr:arginine--tRNA ligase [Streptomonospora litoralis]QBI56151.1 Arginine--tRNA ligase [Streptomonospora litoralis]